MVASGTVSSTKSPSKSPPTAKPISLLFLLSIGKNPLLTRLIGLAHALANCLLYPHTVNCPHKSFGGDSVNFFSPPGNEPDYVSPTIAGFDYVWPESFEEQTNPPPEHPEHDMYRHPDTLIGAPPSIKKKSYDIHSFIIVLVEIIHLETYR